MRECTHSKSLKLYLQKYDFWWLNHILNHIVYNIPNLRKENLWQAKYLAVSWNTKTPDILRVHALIW
jgi:hypothetical protein